MRTVTDLPLSGLVTWTLVSMGRLLCAAVMALGSNCSPLAVGWGSLYMEASQEPPWPLGVRSEPPEPEESPAGSDSGFSFWEVVPLKDCVAASMACSRSWWVCSSCFGEWADSEAWGAGRASAVSAAGGPAAAVAAPGPVSPLTAAAPAVPAAMSTAPVALTTTIERLARRRSRREVREGA